MPTTSGKIRATVLGLLLVPSAVQAKVQILCDSARRPEIYWVVYEGDVDMETYSSRPDLLRSMIPRLGYRRSMNDPPNLPEGGYYLFPVCPNVGISPPGKYVSSSETSTTIRCP
jgi:hypothetical protein